MIIIVGGEPEHGAAWLSERVGSMHAWSTRCHEINSH